MGDGMILPAKALRRHLSEDEYEAKVRDWQLRLLKVERRLINYRRAAVILFEGPDAAGKGGAIKRFTEVLDPRGFKAYAIGVPTEEELQHHYLWRFWTRLPKRGEMALFDRSWYGRVLVERVEKLVSPGQVRQAFTEINEFEAMLLNDRAEIFKFWLDISKEEQLRRFRARAANPLKRWKLTKDDWHNRRHWSAYAKAARKMTKKTSTPQAPWFVVPAECKIYARLEVIRMVTRRLESLPK